MTMKQSTFVNWSPKGAFIYMADLARAISLPIEFDFMAVSSYGNATKLVGLFE